ncbi:MAG: YkvA family protein [Myxococcales bacterium]
MADSEVKFLDAFGAWLRSLGDDAQQLGAVLGSDEVAPAARQAAAGGLNYLFKSLDLIPDGIDDIGYLDDAFVLRVAAAQAVNAGATGHSGLARLAEEDALVSEFLGPSYARLEKYVSGLRTGAARGRTVQEILGKEKLLEEFLNDVKSFAASYQAPSFSREPKSLVKLRAFFDAKLPR